MKKLIAIISLLLAISASFASPEESWHAVGPAFKVHGRLGIARSGTLAPRIWVVGTKRLLGVPPAYGDDPLYLPARLNQLAWDNYVFADFTVVPFTKDEPGVMQIVRIASAENIVVTDWDLNFLYQIEGKIEQEPNAERSDKPAVSSLGTIPKRAKSDYRFGAAGTAAFASTICTAVTFSCSMKLSPNGWFLSAPR